MAFKSFSSRRVRAFTLTELLVVIAIMALLGAMLSSVYARMQRSQKLSIATDRVMSALQLARSLAISKNAIHHIRIGNETAQSQFIATHCYPNVSDALAVNDQDDAAIGTQYEWSSHATLNPKDSAGVEFKTTAGNSFLNYRVNQTQLDAQIFLGVHADTKDNREKLLYFFPDGTANTGMVIYLTEDKKFADTEKTEAEQNDLFIERDNKFISNPNIRMIQVFQGGMVKIKKER